jgi:hypothetical protein
MLAPLAKGSGPPARYANRIVSTLRGMGGVAWLPHLTEAVHDAGVGWDEVYPAQQVRAAAADPHCPVRLAVDPDGYLFAYLGSS